MFILIYIFEKTLQNKSVLKYISLSFLLLLEIIFYLDSNKVKKD